MMNRESARKKKSNWQETPERRQKHASLPGKKKPATPSQERARDPEKKGEKDDFVTKLYSLCPSTGQEEANEGAGTKGPWC